MKAKIIVEGKFNDATKIKNELGDCHKSEFYFNCFDEAKSKLDKTFESLSKGNYRFISQLPSTLMFNDAKATIKEY